VFQDLRRLIGHLIIIIPEEGSGYYP
jgi:hypothetical protein